MKKINIFCFGFGQVAKNFVYNLNKTYDVNLATTSRDKTQKKKIYGIINCYGIQNPIKRFHKTDFKTWENNLTTNLNNYAFLLHLFLNSNHSLKKIINFYSRIYTCA